MPDLGLHLIADNPNLTFIAFIGTALLTVVGVRFGFYAFRNMRAADLGAQRALWAYLLYVGAVAAAYGLLGVLEVVSPLRPAFKEGVMLAAALLLALAIREIGVSAALSGDATGPDGRARRVLELGFVAVVAVVVFGTGAFGLTRGLLAVQGAGAVLFAGYGFWFGRRQTARSRVRGTMLDSLLRHLLPVLAFAALVPAADLATVAGLDRAVVVHVQTVLVIMTATALMTATIKLRQNLARL